MSIAAEQGRVSLDDCYRQCRRVARRAGSSFYYPLWLLSGAKRKAMYALYAYCRTADDLADGDAPLEARGTALDRLGEELDDALASRPSGPVLRALTDVVQRYQVPRACLFDILAGVKRDLTPARYDTWEDLRGYCYQVAGAVGLACLCVWECRAPEAQNLAVRCGEAFQLTNILRDIRADAERGRVYLPMADLAECNCREVDLKTNSLDARLQRLVALQADRARSAFADAAALVDLLPAGGRAVYRAMHVTYLELLKTIERRGGDVFSRPVRLSRAKKFWIVANAWRADARRRPPASVVP